MANTETTNAMENNNANENAEQASKPRTLPQLANSINSALKRAAKEYLKVGEMLTQAREFHANQKEFLAWSLENCNLKKSQTFNLMKCFKEFGNDERFEGCAVRVLLILSGQKEEVKEEAAAAAAEGNLDSKAAEKIVEDSKPEGERKADKVAPATEAPATEAPFDTGAPAEASAEDDALAAMVAELAELRKQNEEQQQLIRDLTAALNQKDSKPAVQRVAPMLPQFKSISLACRLGLTEEEAADNKKVAARYRSFVKIYDEESNAQAYKLLTEAREGLKK